MTVNGLHNLREWHEIGDAAEYLSSRLPDRCSPADILRLAIDGDLAISLYLPTEVVARCEARDGAPGAAQKHRRIQGLCDIPMLGRARLQIEHDYQWLDARRYVPIDGPVGALVEHGDMVCQVPPDRGESGMSPRSQSEFPQGAVLCVRTSVLETFAQEYRAAHPVVVPNKEQSAASPVVSVKEVEKPLDRRERTSLLVIIAALADNGPIDVTSPSAADTIKLWTEKLGAPLDKRTIQPYLSQVREALEQKKT